MNARIALISLLTTDVPKMKQFYRDVLGFAVKSESDGYVEFASEGVRFAICTRQVMADCTDGHKSFTEETKGQAFELAFPCVSAIEVEETYHKIVASGAVPIKEPAIMPWGQTTAFFADPEGNIHEIFAD